MNWLALILCVAACGVNAKPKDTKLEPTKKELVREAYVKRIESLKGVGWLTPDDCDGMIWSAKAGVAPELGFDPTLAEESPGRFLRRPKDKPCWTPEAGDLGAKTTWSRDMHVCGLLPWALLRRDRDLLERHIAYGEAHSWQMGDPLDDGRTVYSPGLIALTYQARRTLGGADHGAIYVPQLWQEGLVDYQAHLQACSAFLTLELDGSLPMEAWAVIEQNVSRETKSVFYRYLADRRYGDLTATADLILTQAEGLLDLSDYHRKAEDALADWIFVAWLVLR